MGNSVGATSCAGVLFLLAAALPALAQDTSAPEPEFGQSQPSEVGEVGADEPFYRIGPQDTLLIQVYNEPDLSRGVAVRPDGRIAFPPLPDEISVVGLTPLEVARTLEERLDAFVLDPRVTVTVEGAVGTFQDRIRVIGDAVSPTDFAYREGMTALDMLIQIGGLPPTAKGNDAYLLRLVDGERQRVPLRLDDLQDGETEHNVRLRAGDVVVVPEGFFSGEWRLRQSVRLTQAFTDNENLGPSGNRNPAFIRSIAPTISISGEAARFRGNLSGSINLRQQTLNNEFTEIRPRLAGSANFEWLRGTLFTDVAGDISQRPIDNTDLISALPLNQTNQQTVQTYRVSPYLVNRFGRLARLETRYTGGFVFTDEFIGQQDGRRAGASDTISHTLSANLTSGPEFARLGWSLRASASEVGRSGREDLSRRDVILNLDYGLTRGLGLLGRAGYERIDSGGLAEQRIDDPVLMAGIRWTPTPRTSLRVLAGERFGDTSFEGSLRQEVSPRITWTANYNEAVTTSSERLIAGLPGVDDELLDLFDPTDPLDRFDRFDRFDPDDPLALPFEFRDFVTRTRTLRSTLAGQFGRNTIRLTGAWSREDTTVFDEDLEDNSYTGRLSLTRPLRRDLSLDAATSLRRSEREALEFEDRDRRDTTFRGSVGLSYTGIQRMTVTTRYAFSRRDSNVAFGDFTENIISLSANIFF